MRIICENASEDARLVEIEKMLMECGISTVRTSTHAEAVGVSVWSIDDVTSVLGENADRNLKRWERLSEDEKIRLAQGMISELLESMTEKVFEGIQDNIETWLDDHESKRSDI